MKAKNKAVLVVKVLLVPRPGAPFFFEVWVDIKRLLAAIKLQETARIQNVRVDALTITMVFFSQSKSEN